MAALALIISSLSWSIGSAVYKQASATAGILQINLFRCAVSVILGGLTAVWLGGIGPLLAAPGDQLLVMAGSGILARLFGDTLFFMSAARIGLSRAMPIAAIYPVWSVMIGHLKGEPTSAREVVAMLVTLAGVLLVIQSGHIRGPARARGHQVQRSGYLIAVACSWVWAFGMLSAKWSAGGINPFLINIVRMGAGGLALVVVLAWQRKPLFPHIRMGRGKVAAASVLESWLASACYIYGLANTSTAVGSTLSSLSPVFTIPVAAIYLRERVSLPLVAGIILATAGVVGLVAR